MILRHNFKALMNCSMVQRLQGQRALILVQTSTRCSKGLLRTTPHLQKSSQQRTYMDVHQRPSHSGMFERKNNPASQNSNKHPDDDSFKVFTTLLFRAVLAATSVFAIQEYLVDITLCEGPSMDPTLQSSGEIIVVDLMTLLRYGLADGCVGEERSKRARQRQASWEQQHGKTDDVIWYESRISVTDLDENEPLSWRQAWKQIRSPLSVGDVVVVKNPVRKGTVCKRVVGLPGDQVLTVEPRRNSSHLQVVPDGHLWLEGDNPANSTDSRQYGPVPAALVVGRVLFRIWPLRGKAWMRRGGPPRHSPPSVAASASTVLPAGYEGQRIVKYLDNNKVEK